MMRSPGATTAVLATVTTLALVGPGTATAEERGSFKIIQSHVHDFTTIEHADGTITGGSNTGTSTVIFSSGEPFVTGMNSIVTCIPFVKMSEGGIDLETACTITDTDSDSWYLLAQRREGNLKEGGGGAGRFEIMGGTGKYAGISGNCPYDTEYLPENRLISSSECAWTRP